MFREASKTTKSPPCWQEIESSVRCGVMVLPRSCCCCDSMCGCVCGCVCNYITEQLPWPYWEQHGEGWVQEGGWVFKKGSSQQRNETRSWEASGIRQSHPTMRCLPSTHSHPSTPHPHSSTPTTKPRPGEQWDSYNSSPRGAWERALLEQVWEARGYGYWLHW